MGAEVLAGTFTLASATFLDLLRRPGLLVAGGIMAALVLVQDQLASSAFDETGALALELTFTTLALYSSALAGFLGLRSAQPADPLGPTAEVLTAPVGPAGFVLGRFLGVVALVAVHLTALSLVALLSIPGVLDLPARESDLVIGLVCALTQSALFAAIGLVVGALVPRPTDVLVLLFVLVAARTAVPALSQADGIAGAIATILPDALRVDVSREIAFGHRLPLGPVLLALAGALAQSAALVLLAALGLPRIAAARE